MLKIILHKSQVNLFKQFIYFFKFIQFITASAEYRTQFLDDCSIEKIKINDIMLPILE